MMAHRSNGLATEVTSEAVNSPMTLQAFSKEPYRLLFPAGMIAGILGVLLWPLFFARVIQLYPGIAHPRIMTFGFFGAFIFGFLGTALPRLLSARPFRPWEMILLLALHLAMLTTYLAGKVFAGDLLFLGLLGSFLVFLAIRLGGGRKDLPPPGFVLVGMSLLCALGGIILAVTRTDGEQHATSILLSRLLCYQGFVLLPILGIGPFLLPRFFGLKSPHDLPDSSVPSAPWLKKAGFAFVAGILIIGSFWMEVSGWLRSAHALRFGTMLIYVFAEMPFGRAPKTTSALGLSIRIAFGSMLAGFLAIAFFPVYRITLLHLPLVGGFAVLVFVVATRVIFGHSGHLDLLKGRCRWLLASVGVMLFGLVTRMSGDFWPKVMVSHYSYGAILWVIGVLIWGWFVLPKVLVFEEE